MFDGARRGGQFVLGAEVIVFALTRSVRYVCAGRGKRDGRPVPYEGIRYCANVSKEYVGEAFRLPAGSADVESGLRTPRRGVPTGCTMVRDDPSVTFGDSSPVRGAFADERCSPLQNVG